MFCLKEKCKFVIQVKNWRFCVVVSKAELVKEHALITFDTSSLCECIDSFYEAL